MNDLTSFDRTVAAWLEASGPSDIRPQVVDAALATARGTRQRHRLLSVVGPAPWPTRGVRRYIGLPVRWPTRGVTYLLIVVGLIMALIAAAVVVGSLRNARLNPPPGRNGAIAYELADTDAAQPHHIRLIHADGTGDRDLALGSMPVFSGDGSALAYFSDLSSGESSAPLIVAASDGSSPRMVETTGAISPDGSQVAATEQDGLWLATVADGSRHLIVRDPSRPFSFYENPVWSSDGKWIAYDVIASVQEGHAGPRYVVGIDVVDPVSGEVRHIASRVAPGPSSISWSPDSEAITYVALPDGSPLPSSSLPEPPMDVFAIRVDGTGERNLTTSPTSEIDPVWAPDGSAIAYLVCESQRCSVAVIGLRGLDPVGPSVLGPSADEIVWSPDATQLLSIDTFPLTPDGNQVGGTITTVDARLAAAPRTLVTYDREIGSASWQRVAP